MKDKSIQEEIREGLNAIIGDCLITIGCGGGGCPKAEMQEAEAQETCLKEILKYLDSKNVRICRLPEVYGLVEHERLV